MRCVLFTEGAEQLFHWLKNGSVNTCKNELNEKRE